MKRYLCIVSVFASLLLVTGCKSNNEGNNETNGSTLTTNTETNHSANDAILGMIDGKREELAELERKHNDGTISERDYQLEKAVNEKVIEQLYEKLK